MKSNRDGKYTVPSHGITPAGMRPRVKSSDKLIGAKYIHIQPYRVDKESRPNARFASMLLPGIEVCIILPIRCLLNSELKEVLMLITWVPGGAM